MILRNVIWHKMRAIKCSLLHPLEYLSEKNSSFENWLQGSIAKLKEEKRHVFLKEYLIMEANENGLKRKLVVAAHHEGWKEIVDRLSSTIEAGKIDS